jgi:hypothetical protein
LDRELQYHTRRNSLGKHAKAVKRMMGRLHCRETGAWCGFAADAGRPFWDICLAVLCRCETAPMPAIGAKPFSVKDLFQHISGI